VSQLQQNAIGSALDASCDYYLPRVFGYFTYWVKDVDKAEALAVETLKQALRKIEGLNQKTDSISIQIFSLARQLVNTGKGDYQTILKGLSRGECEVISLKIGAELSNRCIGAVLGLPDSIVGTLLARSLTKLKSKFDEK
jgi:DNA-directed RNA polymerase specialized sigma24 family protein